MPKEQQSILSSKKSMSGSKREGGTNTFLKLSLFVQAIHIALTLGPILNFAGASPPAADPPRPMPSPEICFSRASRPSAVGVPWERKMSRAS
jgi:hypothetical protein